MNEKIEPILNVTFEVIAYDEGGYGDNRTRSFTNGQEAVDYARSLDQIKFNPLVIKRITMQPISIEIDHTK